MNQKSPTTQPACVRCAVYTRKSTDEGLEREFNTLDAQREAAQNYVASQKQEGWICLPDRYDDGGFSGGNMRRPALERLLEDAAAGRIDCVLVYKVDRLSRSLLDFARMMEVFERHGVSFVSVTQQFNTATSMGRLMLNVLLSFAQFEREIISERTRDKMRAARRRGQRLGGTPVLGYDVDPQTHQLVVLPPEAERVRAIFQIYGQLHGLTATVRELARRGWVAKRWTTRKGIVRGGRPFNKASLHYLLTNVTYLGRVRFQGQIYEGDHEAIVPEAMFGRVQQLLSQNRRARRRSQRSGCRGLLEGVLYCAPCEAPMVHTYTSKGSRRYRYYVCSSAQQRGRETCPSRSVPAEEIERFIWQQVIGDSDGAAQRSAREALSTSQQAERLAGLLERVEYDGRDGDLDIWLRPKEKEAS